MNQLDMFTEPNAPSQSGPTFLRLDDQGSYVQIIVAPNEGTWGHATDDWYQGYTGHCAPMWGHHPSFSGALDEALRTIERNAVHIQIDRSSCCGDRHRAFATKVRAWVREIEVRFDAAFRDSAG